MYVSCRIEVDSRYEDDFRSSRDSQQLGGVDPWDGHPEEHSAGGTRKAHALGHELCERVGHHAAPMCVGLGDLADVRIEGVATRGILVKDVLRESSAVKICALFG